MTYQDAENYRDSYKDIIGKSRLERLPYNIGYVLIAPKEKEFADRISVLNENRYKPIDNKLALQNLGFLNENLDVYIIWEVDNKPHEMLLYDYVNEAGIQ